MHGKPEGRGWRGARRVMRMLEPTLMLLLHCSPTHGYSLLEDIQKYGFGNIDPSVLYRALHQMEGRGWIISAWDEEQSQGPPRRMYHLTADGDAVLNTIIKDLQVQQEHIQKLMDAYQKHMQECTSDFNNENISSRKE